MVNANTVLQKSVNPAVIIVQVHVDLKEGNKTTDIEHYLECAQGEANEGNFQASIYELVQAIKKLTKRLRGLNRCSECGFVRWIDEPKED